MDFGEERSDSGACDDNARGENGEREREREHNDWHIPVVDAQTKRQFIKNPKDLFEYAKVSGDQRSGLR